MDLVSYHIAIVIPAYKVEKSIQAVLDGLPAFVKHIIVVDDASPDATREKITAASRSDGRIVPVILEQNLGVGGAMIAGFRKALELGAKIVVKVDGDGQMDPAYIPSLVKPLILGKADYVKGNRFRDFRSLNQMPLIRRAGNLGLSFLTKAATGYWNIFDPTNGYFAVRAEVLEQLPLEKIDRRYFFETSMLANLYLINAFVLDIPIPAKYGGEESHLSIRRVLFEFPYKLTLTFLRRIVLKNYIFDFSILSLYILTGLPLFLFGMIFGIIKWIEYATKNIPAPTGTVMIPALSVILGIQIMLSAIELDIKSAPNTPLTSAL